MQRLALDCRDRSAMNMAGRLVGAAEVGGQHGVVVARAAREGELFGGPPIEARFSPQDSRRRRVLHDRQAVRAEEGELEVVPFFVVERRRSSTRDRSSQPVFQPTSKLVRLVGQIGREGAAAIDAARPIAGRIGEVDQVIVSRTCR